MNPSEALRLMHWTSPRRGSVSAVRYTRRALAAHDVACSQGSLAVKHLHILSQMIWTVSTDLRGGETCGTGIQVGRTRRNPEEGPTLKVHNWILCIRQPFVCLIRPLPHCWAEKTETASFPSTPLLPFGKPPASSLSSIRPPHYH